MTEIVAEETKSQRYKRLRELHLCLKCEIGKRAQRKAYCRSCLSDERKAWYWASEENRKKCKANSDKWRRENPERWAFIVTRSTLKNLTPDQRQSVINAINEEML